MSQFLTRFSSDIVTLDENSSELPPDELRTQEIYGNSIHKGSMSLGDIPGIFNTATSAWSSYLLNIPENQLRHTVTSELHKEQRPDTEDVCAGEVACNVVQPEPMTLCKSMTPIILNAIIRQDDEGALVVNTNWRGKPYAGALIESSQKSFSAPMLGIRRNKSVTKKTKRRRKRGRGVARRCIDDQELSLNRRIKPSTIDDTDYSESTFTEGESCKSSP